MTMPLQDALNADVKRAQVAVDEVFEQICCQETLEPEAPLVLPELIKLLGMKELRIKPFVLSVLGTIWEIAVQDRDVPGLFPAAVDFVPEEERAPHVEYSELLDRTLRVFEERLDSFRALLRDADPAVRSRTARVLGLSLAHQDETARLVQQAYEVEEHREVRATQLLTLGALSSLPSGTEDDELCRSCRVIAQVWSGSPVRDVDFAALAAIAHSPRIDLEYFRWLRGAIAGLAAEALVRLLPVDQARAMQALSRAIRFQATEGPEASGAEPGEDWPLPSLMSEYLVFAVLKPFDGRGSEVVLSELDELQRDVLNEIGVELGIFTWAQRRCGIPLRPFDLRRYLGREAFGPLDSVTSLTLGGRHADWPLWKWLRFAHRNGLTETLIDRLVDRMTPSELFGLYKDVASGVYDPADRGPGSAVPFATRLAQRDVLRDMDSLEAYAFELLRTQCSVSQAAAAMIPLLGLARENRRSVSEQLDPLIEILVREGGNLKNQVLELLPFERRPAFEKIVPRAQSIPESMRRFFERRGTMP